MNNQPQISDCSNWANNMIAKKPAPPNKCKATLCISCSHTSCAQRITMLHLSLLQSRLPEDEPSALQCEYNIHRRRSDHLRCRSTLLSCLFLIVSFSLLPKGVNMKCGAAGTASKHLIPILRVFIHYASVAHGSWKAMSEILHPASSLHLPRHFLLSEKAYFLMH